MIQLLADVNIEGHVGRIVAHMRSDFWWEVWDYLDIRSLSFQHVGLSRDDIDAHVWQVCQQQQLYLLTSNRNDDGPDSLEATIRQHNNPSSLPVFTFSDADQIYHSNDYADRVTESLLDKLLRIDSFCGSGRLWLP